MIVRDFAMERALDPSAVTLNEYVPGAVGIPLIWPVAEFRINPNLPRRLTAQNYALSDKRATVLAKSGLAREN